MGELSPAIAPLRTKMNLYVAPAVGGTVHSVSKESLRTPADSYTLYHSAVSPLAPSTKPTQSFGEVATALDQDAFMVFPAATSMALQPECLSEGPACTDCYTPPATGLKCNGGVFTVITQEARNHDSPTNGLLHWTFVDPVITMTDDFEPNQLSAAKLVELCTYIGWGYISSDFSPVGIEDELTLQTTQTSWRTNLETGCCEELSPVPRNITFGQFKEKLDSPTTCGNGTVNNPYRIFTQGSEGGPELCGTSCFSVE